MALKKVTAVAPSNIAFIKYWGKKDEILRLPENGSFSMTLDDAIATATTVEFNPELAEDIVQINGTQDQDESARVIKHLNRIRKMAGINFKARVVSENSFPTGTGISSSASGFAALTVSAVYAAGLELNQREMSILARQGSGSACRSIPGGFVEWLDGNSSEDSYAYTYQPDNFWALADVVAVVSQKRKDISTTEGQTLAESSPFYQTRLEKISDKLKRLKEYLLARDFSPFGELIEAEALELHAIMLTSIPSLIYWSEGTLTLMKLVKQWRNEGLEVYFTINTGQDIHLICQQKDIPLLQSKLKELDFVKKIITSLPGKGTRTVDRHLF